MPGMNVHYSSAEINKFTATAGVMPKLQLQHCSKCEMNRAHRNLIYLVLGSFASSTSANSKVKNPEQLLSL